MTHKANKTNSRAGLGTGLGIALGAGIGTAIGTANDDIGLWLPVGIGIGIALGTIFSVGMNKRCSGQDEKHAE